MKRTSRRLNIGTWWTVAAVGLIAAASTAVWYFAFRTPEPAPASSMQQPTPQTTDEWTIFDTDYVRKVLLNHQQALRIVEQAASRTTTPEIVAAVQTLLPRYQRVASEAQALLAQQGQTYQNLADYPEEDGHDMYPTNPGMATAAEVKQLETLEGAAFDDEFVRLLLQLHQGMQELGETIGKKASHRDAAAFRQQLQTVESQQLSELQRLR